MLIVIVEEECFEDSTANEGIPGSDVEDKWCVHIYDIPDGIVPKYDRILMQAASQKPYNGMYVHGESVCICATYLHEKYKSYESDRKVITAFTVHQNPELTVLYCINCYSIDDSADEGIVDYIESIKETAANQLDANHRLTPEQQTLAKQIMELDYYDFMPLDYTDSIRPLLIGHLKDPESILHHLQLPTDVFKMIMMYADRFRPWNTFKRCELTALSSSLHRRKKHKKR